jgi:hypothetical protein
VIHTIHPCRVVRTHGEKQLEQRKSHHNRVVVAEVRQHSKSSRLDGLVGNKTSVDKAQVEPVGVVRVSQHSDDHPATGNAQALELGHLVSRWSCVASDVECLPRKAWKTLPVQPVGTDRTVSVELVKHRETHLYQKCNTCQVSMENGMSNGEVLAAVNKHS